MESTKKKFEKSFFERWANDYDRCRNKSFLEKSKKRTQNLLEHYLVNKENFLEIGVGTGESFEIVSRKFNFSFGMDISEGMIRRTNYKVGKNKNLFVADGCNLPLRSDSFDFIICQDVLEHVPKQEKLILEICRILKLDGIGIITTPNPIWAPILYVAEKLKMKVKEGEHNFVFLPKLVVKLLEKSNCKILNTNSFMMLPIKSKLDGRIEPLSSSFWSRLGFSQMCVIKKEN